MRNSLPSISPSLCMNYGNIYTGDDLFDAKQFERNLREMKALGITKIRFGGTSPQYIQQARGDFVGVAAQMLLAKRMGFYIENGTTNLLGVDPAFTSTNWVTYHDYAVALAQALYASGLDAFMVANEQLSTAHIDGTTIPDIQALYTRLVQLGADIRAVCPTIKITYNGQAAGGTGGEWDNWTTWIANNGPIPSYMQLGFNLYGGDSHSTGVFQSQVNSVKALNGYVSEWNIVPGGGWTYGYQWNNTPFDEEVQYNQTVAFLQIIQNSGMDGYFWTWKNHNKGAPGDWNNWAIFTNNGTPTIIDNGFDVRPSYPALFTKRKYMGGNKRSIFLDGNAYIDTGIIPASTGICIGFWHKRHRIFSGNAEHLFSSAAAGDGYLNGIRLYHDQNSRNLVFNTLSAGGSNGFNVVPTYRTGMWTHIVVLISSAGSILYLNGVKTGGTFSGNIGTPTHSLVIGARAVDFAVKGQFCIDRLTIQNTPTAWTEKQVKDLMRYDIKPSGSSYYYFNHDGNDNSGNGYNLTLSSTVTYSLNVPIIRKPNS